MKRVAFTVWEGRISPVFDVSRTALVLWVEHQTIIARSTQNIETPNPEQKPQRLLELGIRTLVCGAISEPLQHELVVGGIQVIGFVAGQTDEVIESFLRGALPTPALTMPGCRNRRQRRLRWRGQGRCQGKQRGRL